METGSGNSKLNGGGVSDIGKEDYFISYFKEED
jgi:hypothetical protein